VIQPSLKTLTIVVVALVISACATLPEGVPPAPRDDPAAGTLTLPSGRAVPVYPDQLTYHGDAHFRWPDGRTYHGGWVNGRPHGRGVETLPDGTIYDGEWQQGRRDGQGELTQADGSRYVGDFVTGVRKGTGTLTSDEGVYRGDWSADVPHGQGVFDARDGSRYDGEWQLGQRFGYGRYATPDGASYQGDWAYDQPHGFGRLEGPDDATYQGAWQRGRRQGYGRAHGPPGLVYEGTWVNDKKHGFGREERPDGSSYVGDWQAGKRHGQGLEVRPEGSFHDGTWELNQALGPGQRRAATGIEISGVWNGDSVSRGLLHLPGGLEYAGPLFSRGASAASPRLIDWLHAAAGRGDPFAQLMLGTLYLDQEEPPPDLNRARKWLGQAAHAGIAEAQFRLALTYEDVNPPRVVDLLSQAARQAHPLANETLGEYYYGGITVPRNLDRAIAYFQHAVDAGSVTARNNLAWLLATAGQAKHRDGERAVELIGPVALYSGAWQYLDTLAAAWAAAGEFDKAVATARQAIEAAARQSAELAAGRMGDLRLEDSQPEDIQLEDTQLEDMERRLAGYRNRKAYVEPGP
jgi:TPR repeat protein